MSINFVEQSGSEIVGVYPMAVAFYTAYLMGGGEQGFPFPVGLNQKERGIFAEARRNICQAIADGERIDLDGGEQATVLMFGGALKKSGSASEMRQSLEAASMRAQLAAFYEKLGVPDTF